jgi:hypothetical protein
MGSGERWSKKGVVEGRQSIDTADLKRLRLLVPGGAERAGSLEWRRGREAKPYSSVSYRLTVGRTSGTMRLIYSIPSLKADLDYAVRLVATPCHLGGVRLWFLCPLSKGGLPCCRRVRKLYLSSKYFGCRHCHNLTYTSRQQSDSRVYALARAGLDAMPPIGGASVSQLGVVLKALDMMQKRFDRFDV